MTYQPTILNISAGLFILGIMIYSLLNWATLSGNGGWGVVYMVGLIGAGLVGGLADLTLQAILANRTLINAIGLVIAIGLAVSIIWGKG